jgi:gamma-glutamylaminecyclotransferase
MREEDHHLPIGENMHRLFVYGTLRNGYGNHTLIKDSIREEDSKLKGFDMYTHGLFPFIVEGKGEVNVESYVVDDYTLQGVDRLEGHPTFYTRTKVKDVNGREGNTYVYRHDTTSLDKIESGDWNEYRKGGQFYV